ncbi:MAG: hypothetical protein NMNS01_12930 [Nitrosomonas sp.]|nr:MAG: hypothetical protein NMNS01_12930 [Nitrosomonas sp.]
MRYCKNPELVMWLSNLLRGIGCIGLIAATLFTATELRAESGIRIKFVDLIVVDNGYQLNVDSEVVLNNTLEQALKKGVTLYITTKFSLVEPRWYWFDQEVARSKLRMGLSYNALTRQYRLSPKYETWTKNFDTLNEALRVLSRMHGYPVTILSDLKEGIDYIATLRIWLDLSRLPKPFQVETLGSKAWHLTSDRLEWRTNLPLSAQPLYQQGDL